jgi:ABC-type polar amino acid transport system ATPase subunit
MIIKKLILKGYKRLFLNRINVLEYIPNKSMQIILGRNASGKTSILRQLNPLPVNLKHEFYDNGYKYIELEHHNKNYILSSGYTSSNKHSFKLNDKELNDGGTKKVQLDLIKEHFNLTPEIIDILLNNNRLTTMSIVDRKKWLSELSTVDYSFSIGLYNKLRARHRDLIGGIKLIQENIIKYENNILKENELIKLKEDKKVLEDYYKHIISLYDHSASTVKIDNYNTLEDNINNLRKLLKDMQPGNIEEEINKKNKLLLEYDTKSKFITKTVELISQLEKVPEIKDIKLLKERQQKLIKLIDDKYKIKTIKEIDARRSSNYYLSFTNIFSSILVILNQLEEYENIRLMSKEEQDKIIELDTKLTNNFSILNKKIELIKTEIEHINKHKTQEHLIECPQCKHKWYNGYNQNTIDGLTRQKQELEKKITAYTEIYNKNKNILDKINTKNKLIDSFIEIIKSNIELKPIWDIIVLRIDINKSTISEILTVFNNINTELFNTKELSKLIEEKEKNEVVLQNYEASKKLEFKDKELQIKDLTKILETTTIEKNKILETIKQLDNNINKLKSIQELHNNLKKILITNRVNLCNKIILIRNQYLTELSDYIKEEIIKIEQLTNQQLQNNIKLEKDKKSLDIYKQREKILNLMVKELSPTEGLIALSINSFLNVFVQEMNDVLDKIWSFPLELLPCEANEENDLDYKFKVKVNNDEVIEDVSKLSSSCKEIVDLAFRIVFAKYMHLDEIPLYLDEFGSTFDPKNMSNAYYVIETLANIDYPQIFIISHFEHVYGSIKNADFNILDSNNISTETLQNKQGCLIIN